MIDSKETKGKDTKGMDSETLSLIAALEEQDKAEAENRKFFLKRKREEDESLALAMHLDEEDKKKEADRKRRLATENKSKGGDPTVVFCPLGVVLLKKALDDDSQLGIINTLMEMQGNDLQVAPGQTSITPLFMYNWPSKYASSYKPKVNGHPTDLLNFGQKMFDKCASFVKAAKDVGAFDKSEYDKLSSDLKCPMVYKPDAIYAIAYGPNGTLHSHVDGQMGWVLGVSMGDACDFFFSKTATGGRHTIRLESGDMCLFNGQTLYHGVSKIHAGTAPKWFTTKNGIPANVGRINLQYRDPSKIV